MSDKYEFYDYDDSKFPMIVTWMSPFDGDSRSRILRSEEEMNEFFSWFDKKYPDIDVTIS